MVSYEKGYNVNNIKQKQISDSFFLGILLAIVGGYLDVYTYILRGKVFANAQTGNIVLLGLSIAEGNIRSALYYLVPILAFVLGIIASELIKKKYREQQNVHWRQITISIEFIVLLLVGFIPLGKFNMLANVLISFVCSMQMESFRTMNGSAYATTMCTGNLRCATEQLCKFNITRELEARNKSCQYYFIIIAFIIGAIGGAIGSNYFGVQSIWICCLILAIVFIKMYKK